MAFRNSWLQQATLYKFRFLIGYGVIIALFFFIVGADIGNIPNGLSAAEMQQAVTSSSLHPSLDPSWLINLPFNAIQKVAVEAFGLSRLSLVLPSLIFGIASIVLFVLTMRHWFRDSVAVVATAIAVTSVLFVTMLRSATPDIMLPFWSLLLLYGAVRLLVKRERAFGWKLTIVAATIGLLYTPYGIYPLVAIFASALMHPHVRSRLRHIKHIRLVILSLLLLAGIMPLVLAIILHPNTLNTLLGLDEIRYSATHLRQSASQVYDMYINILKNGFSGEHIVPLYNLTTLAIALLGAFKSMRDHHMARSYVLLSWAGVTVLTTLFLPNSINLVFLPATLLMAIGIDTLIVEWYRLFPRNPYARVAGLLPLTVLFLGVASGNISQYFNDYNHITNPFFTQSLPAIQQSLTTEGNHAVILVTRPEDVAFYRILKKEHALLTVTSTLPKDASTPTFVLPNVDRTFALIPSHILTSPNKNDAAVLRIYRPQ